jgi:hypothetical protein
VDEIPGARFDWIEVYDGDRIFTITCASSPSYTERLLREQNGVTVFADADALLAHTRNVAYGRRVVVAMGDSNTASWITWARCAARTAAAAASPADRLVVINIGRWAEYATQHVPRLQHLLDFPGLCSAAEAITGVYLGGLIDCGDRALNYRRFVEGARGDPEVDFERQAAAEPGGRRLARLLSASPDDEAVAPRWIARRALASVQMLADVAVERGIPFFAILQPLCYDDLVPSYRAVLHAYHAASAPHQDFGVWCRSHEKPYAVDFDAYYGAPMRAEFDQLRAIWTQASLPGKAAFVDWAGYFRNVPKPWYSVNFDACHYGIEGYAALGLGVARLVIEGRARDQADPD